MDEYKKMLKNINLKDKKYQQILDHNVTKWISTFQVGGREINYGGFSENELRALLDDSDADNIDNTIIYVPKSKLSKGDFNNSNKLITGLKTLDPSSYLILFNNIEESLRDSILKAFQNNDDINVRIKFLQLLTVLLFNQNINIKKLNKNADVKLAVAAAAAAAAAPASIDIETNRFVTIASPISADAAPAAAGAATPIS